MKKIKELVKENESVWFYLKEEDKKDFVDEINLMNLKFKDGSDVTYENCGLLMAITNDKVTYVSHYIWVMSFHVDTFHKIRIDYEKYRNNDNDYIIKESNIRGVLYK